MITVDDLLAGLLAFAQSAAVASINADPTVWNFYKESFDLSEAGKSSVTAFFVGGQGSVRSAVDKLTFNIILASTNYSTARQAALDLYGALNGLFDLLSTDVAKSGYNGHWACDPPAAIPFDQVPEGMTHVFFFTLPAQTLAEIR